MASYFGVLGWNEGFTIFITEPILVLLDNEVNFFSYDSSDIFIGCGQNFLSIWLAQANFLVFCDTLILSICTFDIVEFNGNTWFAIHEIEAVFAVLNDVIEGVFSG